MRRDKYGWIRAKLTCLKRQNTYIVSLLVSDQSIYWARIMVLLGLFYNFSLFKKDIILILFDLLASDLPVDCVRIVVLVCLSYDF